MVVRSQIPSVEVPMTSVQDHVMENMEEHGDIVNIESAETGAKYTARQVASLSESIAWGLQASGFNKGDIALLAVPNSPEYCLFALGVLRAGGVVSGINCMYTEDEISDRLQDCHAPVILCANFYYETVKAGIKQSPGIIKNVYIPDPFPGQLSDNNHQAAVHPFSDLLQFKQRNPHYKFHKHPIVPKEDLAFLPYSSGTTGKPKGVKLTHYNMVASMAAFEGGKFLAMEPGEPTVNVLPFYHAFGQAGYLNGFRGGTRIITMARFEPKLFLKTIQDNKIWVVALVPPLMVFLAKDPIVNNYDISCLRAVIVGAAPAGKELIDEFKRRHPYVEFVGQGYGMTEGTVSTCITPPGDIPSGSCGILLSGWEAKVLDLKTGRELGEGEDGEICIRSVAVMQGYYKRPKETANTIDADGFLHTGDIGHYDENGFFFIVDRLKELIKVKGFQVPPAELEDILLSHPGIWEAAVIGLPDAQSGEVPKAFVVLKQPGTVSEDDVKNHVAGRVAPYKKLRFVEFVKEIPKSPSGKVLRRELRDAEKAKLANRSKL